MESLLFSRATELSKTPKKFRLGDIMAQYDRDFNILLHTAVYIGKGNWFHQVGYLGPFKVHKMRTAASKYPGRKRFYRKKR